ncbi:MAG TPA: hypothetical protein VGT98_10480 [Candidatus Elarobacter sp.]|nr:hypothetical protein [Candidatus Elarobacter sp.]
MTSSDVRRVVSVVVGLAIGASPAAAQRVTLRVHPPIGDTLHMELQQQFDMQAMDGGGSPMSGTLRVWTHSVPLRRSGTSTEVLSVTDSVVVTPPSAASLRPLREAKRALEGRTVHLRVEENGEMIVGRNDGTSAPAQLPSVLPHGPVVVGESWTRDLRVPLSTTGTSTALARTTFRLDSLGHDGVVAFVSMRGDVSHDHAEDGNGATGQTTGTLTGTMQIDRRLSWITDSRMRMSLTSDVRTPGRAPARVRMQITQMLRTLPGS